MQEGSRVNFLFDVVYTKNVATGHWFIKLSSSRSVIHYYEKYYHATFLNVNEYLSPTSTMYLFGN